MNWVHRNQIEIKGVELGARNNAHFKDYSFVVQQFPQRLVEVAVTTFCAGLNLVRIAQSS